MNKLCLSVFITLSCGCGVTGIIDKSEPVKINRYQFPISVRTVSNRGSIQEIINKQAVCQAYKKASLDGADRSRSLARTIAFVGGFVSLGSAAVSGISGAYAAFARSDASNAANSTTPSTSSASSAAENAQTALITSLVAAGTALAIGTTTLVTNVFGPNEANKKFLEVRKSAQDYLDESQREIDKFLADYSEANQVSDAAAKNAKYASAQMHLGNARDILAKCDALAIDLNWKGVETYTSKAESINAKIIRSGEIYFSTLQELSKLEEIDKKPPAGEAAAEKAARSEKIKKLTGTLQDLSNRDYEALESIDALEQAKPPLNPIQHFQQPAQR